MSEEKEKEKEELRKGKNKGKERERKREKKGKEKEKDKIGSVSHGPFLMPKVIVFVIVLLFIVRESSLSLSLPIAFSSRVCSFFLKMAAIIQEGL